jgi:hypothetical protein
MLVAGTVGPILFARGHDGSRCALSVIVVPGEGSTEPPPLRPMGKDPVAPAALATLGERTVWRYDFALPAAADAFYQFGTDRHPVATEMARDLRIAYVSCNGQEAADADRALAERNLMWRRLTVEHERAPFSLLLHGGDQLYADEMLESHPAIAAWAESELEARPGLPFPNEAREAAERFLFERYARLYTQPATAPLLATVPSVMMWDDHDIIDGWGSHPPALLDSPVGRGLFAAARRMFLLFQLGMADGSGAGDAPAGRSLSQTVSFPDFRIIAPDLRSERRPERLLGPEGWADLCAAIAACPADARLFLMSSVPLLGPRLSWIEALIGIVPRLRGYEDDLRDQWQSRAHRQEWREMLLLMEKRAEAGGDAPTVLSGEIHLATRGEMTLPNGRVMHQLVASGIAHPPPPQLYARALGWLAALGEAPLPGRPIRLKPLPGQPRIYVAERNYLVLERRNGRWSASWELEDSGRTPPVPI